MQLNIKAAYLNAPLDKDIYVNIPSDKNFGKGYWLLRKALYDLKQSGRRWHIHFTNFLKNNGFTQLTSEPCIFVKMEGRRAVWQSKKQTVVATSTAEAEYLLPLNVLKRLYGFKIFYMKYSTLKNQ